MKRALGIGSLILLFTSLEAYAADGDRCSGLLQDGVRNTLSEKYEKKFLDEFHSAMCSDKEERISKAKNTAINLGYGDFFADFAGNSKRIASYQESMCSSKDTISTGSNFYQLVKNHVSRDLIDGYNKCITITEGGMDYTVTHGKDSDSITIDVSYSRSRAPKSELEVTHIVINPQSLENLVDCQGPLSTVRKSGATKITQATGVQGITCRPGDGFPKTGSNDFSVVVHTTVGHIEGYVTPFHRGKSDRLHALEEGYDNINSQLNRFRTGVVAFEATTCPDGWTPYIPAYGVFIRGLDLSGKNIDPDKREFGKVQSDQVMSHSHPYLHWTSGPNMLPNMAHMKEVGLNTGQPSGNTGEFGGSETRPKNVALLFCQRM